MEYPEQIANFPYLTPSLDKRARLFVAERVERMYFKGIPFWAALDLATEFVRHV